MKIVSSLVREQGVTFRIVLVKKYVIDNPLERQEFLKSFGLLFPQVPLVLAARDLNGRFFYFGRDDIVQFLASVEPSQIPWSELVLT